MRLRQLIQTALLRPVPGDRWQRHVPELQESGKLPATHDGSNILSAGGQDVGIRRRTGDRCARRSEIRDLKRHLGRSEHQRCLAVHQHRDRSVALVLHADVGQIRKLFEGIV